MKRFLLISLLINSLLFSFCKKDETGGTVAPIAQTITSLPADPGTGVDPSNGQPIGTTGKYTLFNFATATVVANTDSATNKWDIGFKGTAIILCLGSIIHRERRKGARLALLTRSIGPDTPQ